MTIDPAHRTKSVLRQQVMHVSAKKDSGSRRTWIYVKTSTSAFGAMIATKTQLVPTKRAALAVSVILATSATAKHVKKEVVRTTCVRPGKYVFHQEELTAGAQMDSKEMKLESVLTLMRARLVKMVAV